MTESGIPGGTTGHAPLVVRHARPMDRAVRSMLIALRNGLYKVVDDDHRVGFRISATRRTGDDELPLPTICFRAETHPMFPPHDPCAIAVTLLAAPTIGSGEAWRISNALVAAASSTGGLPDPATGLGLVCSCATPWSPFTIATGLVDRRGHVHPPIAHDGVVESMLPQVVEATMSDSDLDPLSARTLRFAPFTAEVDRQNLMDPMAVMRGISDLRASPIRSLQA